ncbi:MAG: MATE family efflux transporter, partial [Spirochaetales bacterium]|nr:MATE family efflux transporter [Candidatus Physcosoma equi]
MATKKNIDMTEGKILPLLLAFAIPLFFTGILQILYNAADTMVVGRFAGAQSMAAIGATTSLYHLIINLFVGLSMGVNVVAAHNYGAKDMEKLGRTVHTAITIAFLGGLLISVIGYFAAPLLLRMTGTPEDVFPKAVLYMRIIFLGQPVNLLYNFGSAVLRAYGDTKRPLYYLLFAGAVNVVANLFFVIVLHMDVAGVAVATIMSQAISAVLVIRNLMTTEDVVRLNLKNLGVQKKELKEIIRIGLPAGLQSSLFAISNVVIQSSINSFGSLVIAGNTAALNVESFLNMTATTMDQTNLSAVSQNYGAGKNERLKKVVASSLVLTTVLSVVLGLLMILFGPFILSFYTEDPAVIEYGMVRISILMATYSFYAI